MPFSKKTLRDLEWDRLLEHLAGRATSDLAAEACRALSFLAPKEARRRLALVDELTKALRNDDPPPSLPALPVDEALAHVRSKGMIPAEALRAMSSNLKLYAAVSRYLQNRRDECPLNEAALLGNGAPSPVSMSRLAAEIESAFDPDGNISDSASPQLWKMRQRVISLRKHLLARMADIAEESEDVLRDSTVTLRNDRFVLPVRTDAHRRLNGIVHGSSQTGNTVFIEPEQVVSIGNDLTLAREEVAREEARILTALRDAVEDELDGVAYACGAIVDVETRIAAARLSFDTEASVPSDADPGHLDLRAARHPLLLLEGVAVVPGHMKAERGGTVLVSGPNAGGKTVALKTVGLSCLMLRAGIPIPVDPVSRIGIPDQVLTDIGDDQSLEQNLSTFSAHMKNIASILDDASPGSVILLDELAAGTDPVEGTALAEAILSQLNRVNATTMATTHYDTLKSRAQDAEGFVNVSMGFDLDEGRPTFEMRTGVPGSSSAMAVARTYGIPERVLERARELLPEQVRELTRAVEALDRERKQTELERLALAEQRSSMEREERRLKAEADKLKTRQDKMLDEEAQKLWSAIKRARERVRDAESSLRRRRKDSTAVSSARKAVNEVAEQLDPGGSLSRVKREDGPGVPATCEALVPGAAVRIISMGKDGVVDSPLKGNTIFVRAGALRLRVGMDDLNVLATKPAEKKKKRLAPPPQSPRPDAVRTSDNTLDLRGKRADEAIDATDAYLDQAMKNGVDAVFVLHGHGTNALKDAVREYLAGSPYVDDFRPGERDEGGDGITVVWLR